MNQIFKEVAQSSKLPYMATMYDNEAFANFFNALNGSKNPLTKALSILPAVEYCTRKENENIEKETIFKSKESFLYFLGKYKSEISEFIVTYGIQKSFPQRALMIISYINDTKLIPHGKKLRIVEIGAASGLLGRVFTYYNNLIKDDNFSEMFWTNKEKLPSSFDAEYRGFDIQIPSTEILPYFIWDEEKRTKTKNFIEKTNHLTIDVRKQDAFTFLDHVKKQQDPETMTLIVTSFMLYQISQKRDFVKKILSYDFPWIDLSKNRGDIPHLEGERRNYSYLSLNGFPEFKVINGSDECSDWVETTNQKAVV